MGLHNLSQHDRKMRKLTRRNSVADVMCLQFDITFEMVHSTWENSQNWNKNKTDNKAFLPSIVWQYNKITCPIFGHKFPVKIFFTLAEMPGQSVQPG